MNSNQIIKVKDKYFDYFIGEYELNSLIDNLANKINEDYHFVNESEPLIIVGILNGSFMFLSDIVKKLKISCEIHFIKVSSYIGTESTGKINKLIGLNVDLNNKNVLIIEDIIDTGKTMVNIIKELTLSNPKSVNICTFLYKKIKCKEDLDIKYIGKVIDDNFVVGYGLDYDGQGRNYNCLYKLTDFVEINTLQKKGVAGDIPC